MQGDKKGKAKASAATNEDASIAATAPRKKPKTAAQLRLEELYMPSLMADSLYNNVCLQLQKHTPVSLHAG